MKSSTRARLATKRVFSHLFDCNYRLENQWMAEHIAKDSNDKTNPNAAKAKWFDRPKRLILADVTPEALNLNLLNNGSGLMMYRDEARDFFYPRHSRRNHQNDWRRLLLRAQGNNRHLLMQRTLPPLSTIRGPMRDER